MKNGLRRIQFYLSEESYLKILPEIINSGLTESAFCSEKIAGEKLPARGAPIGNQNKKRKCKALESETTSETTFDNFKDASESAPDTAEGRTETAIRNDVTYIDRFEQIGGHILLSDAGNYKAAEVANETADHFVENEDSARRTSNREKKFQIFSAEDVEDIVGNMDEVFCANSPSPGIGSNTQTTFAAAETLVAPAENH